MTWKPTVEEKLAAFKEAEETKKQQKAEIKESAPDEEKVKNNKTQADVIIELAKDVSFFKTPDNQSYATIQIDSHYETYSLESSIFKRWITGQFYNHYQKSPSSNALKDAISTLKAKALFEGKEKDVYIRLAEADGKIYFDLANKNWEVIKISQDGWKIISESPVKFIRPTGMLSLPCPKAGGSIEELKECLNYPGDDGFKLIVAWLLSTLRPNRPFPILVLQGEQGSAKSTTAKILRSLVDPNKADIRSLPKNEQDLVIAAKNSWILNFDNLSGLKNWTSDALCRVSTGGGFATRKLYTDSEESLFDFKRPIILNGIADIAVRQDLIDRSLVLALPAIEETNRQSEARVLKKFEEIKPKVMGALFDAMSTALKRVSSIELSELPRMADFANLASAAEPAFGWSKGSFIKTYSNNRINAIEIGLDSDPLAIAVRNLMQTVKSWNGSATKLLKTLDNHVGDDLKRSTAWPKVNKLKTRLDRLTTALRSVGIYITYHRTGHERTITLERKIIKNSDITVTTVTKHTESLIDDHFHDDKKDYGNDNPEGISDQYCHQQNGSLDNDIDDHDICDGKKLVNETSYDGEVWGGITI